MNPTNLKGRVVRRRETNLSTSMVGVWIRILAIFRDQSQGQPQSQTCLNSSLAEPCLELFGALLVKFLKNPELQMPQDAKHTRHPLEPQGKS